MQGLISRQAAIDAMGKAKWAKERLMELPPAQPEPHWISCSERMPEEGRKCLVCDKGSIVIDTYIGHGNPYNWKWYTRDYEAWMPLPDSYDGGDSK